MTPPKKLKPHPADWRATLLSGLMAALLLSACGAPSEDKLLSSARELLASNKPDAARLQIKTVLQSNPNSGPARLMLGRLLFASGDMAGAEAEFARALELGQPEASVLPMLAEAMVVQQKSQVLIQQHGNTNLADAQPDGELKTQLAVAEAMDGNFPAARERLAQALKRLPDHVPALLLGARLTAAEGNTAAALKQIEALLAGNPKLADAWMLKADLLQRQSAPDPAAIQDAYQQALAAKPDLVAAHNAIVMAALAKPDLAAANQQFALMQKAAPKHPLTVFLDAVLTEQRGDFVRARELTQLLLRGAPNSPQTLMLAGQVELKLNALTQAESMFTKAMLLVPKAAAPRYQLAQVQMRSGQPDKAITTLRPLVEATPPDAKAMAMTAQAQSMTGDTKGADASMARAAKLSPKDSRVRTSIALSQLGKGQDAGALAELQSIAATDKGSTADVALISAKVRGNDLSGALRAVDALATKMPGQPLPDQLRGRIALIKNDKPGARKHFEAALAKNPDFMPALAGLAALDLGERQAPAARARFEAVLKRQPKNVGAMMALAEIGARSGGKPEETTQWLEKAIQADPTDPTPRLLLIDHLLNRRQAKPALTAAQAALTALPDHPEMLDRVGRAQLAMGETQQAITTFTKLATISPKSPLPQLRLADAQALAKNTPGVTAAVRRAVEIAPKSLQVQQAQVMLAMTENKPAQALAVARLVQAQRPDEAVGFSMEGNIEMRQQHWAGAAAAFRSALTRQQPGDSAAHLHAALMADKKPADADKLVADRRKSHPNDLGFALYLGDRALATNNLPLAETQYQIVLAGQPDSVLALNNLAYVLALQKKPGAVALAERVQLLAPDTPALMDTLAFCLSVESKLPQAIELQTKVVAAAPNGAQFRLQLAKFYLQAGDKPKARDELQTLARLGTAFSRQAEVAELLKSVGG